MNQHPLLPPPGSHFIALPRAIEMTSLYRSQKENILALAFKNQNILPVCETFNRTDLDTVLSHNGCVGLRVYFGMDELLKVRVIMVGVNENNEDMLPVTSALETDSDTGDDILEEGHRCPPACPPPSPLNT